MPLEKGDACRKRRRLRQDSVTSSSAFQPLKRAASIVAGHRNWIANGSFYSPLTNTNVLVLELFSNCVENVAIPDEQNEIYLILKKEKETGHRMNNIIMFMMTVSCIQFKVILKYLDVKLCGNSDTLLMHDRAAGCWLQLADKRDVPWASINAMKWITTWRTSFNWPWTCLSSFDSNETHIKTGIL